MPHPYPRKGALEFIKYTHSQMKKKKSYHLGIISKDNNKLIGIISLSKIDWTHKNAELGYWIGKKHWNKGLMTEAVNLILSLAFKQLKLHRIYAYIFEGNTGSKRVLEKSGFKFEGKRRECVFKDNKWKNDLEYSILAKEFKKR